MKSKKLSVILGSVIAIVVIITLVLANGCSTATSSKPATSTQTTTAAAKVVTLNFCVQHPAQDPMVGVINEAEKRHLWDASGQTLKLNIIPSAGAVSAASELYDAARTGIVDMACHSAERTAGRFTLSDVVMLPGMTTWPSSMQVGMTLRALYNKYPAIQAEYKDVHVLTFHSSSVGVINSFKKPILTLADWQGQVVKTGGEYRIKSAEALGAQVVNLDPGEWYDSASKGVYSIFVDNYVASYIFGVADLINYSTNWGLGSDYFIHVMNLDTWNKLTPDQQKLLTFAAEEEDTQMFGYRFNSDEVASKAKLEAKMKAAGNPGIVDLSADEAAKWQAKVQPIWDLWVKDANAKGAPGQQILDDCIALCKQYSYQNYHPDMSGKISEWGNLPAPK
jgi:TRAP-type transport system periplasmic protein